MALHLDINNCVQNGLQIEMDIANFQRQTSTQTQTQTQTQAQIPIQMPTQTQTLTTMQTEMQNQLQMETQTPTQTPNIFQDIENLLSYQLQHCTKAQKKLTPPKRNRSGTNFSNINAAASISIPDTSLDLLPPSHEFLIPEESHGFGEDPGLFSVEGDVLQPITSQFMVPGIYKKIATSTIDFLSTSTTSKRSNVFMTYKERRGCVLTASDFHDLYMSTNEIGAYSDDIPQVCARRVLHVEPLEDSDNELTELVQPALSTLKDEGLVSKQWDALSKLAYNILKLSNRDHIVIDRKRNEIIRTERETNQKTVYRFLPPESLGLVQTESCDTSQWFSTTEAAATTKPPAKLGRPRKRMLAEDVNECNSLATKKQISQENSEEIKKNSATEATESVASKMQFRTRSGRTVKLVRPVPILRPVKEEPSDAPGTSAELMRNFLAELRDSEYRYGKTLLPAASPHDVIPSPIKDKPSVPLAPSLPTKRRVPPEAICPTCKKIFLGRRLQRHFAQHPTHMSMLHMPEDTSSNSYPTSSSNSNYNCNTSCHSNSILNSKSNSIPNSVHNSIHNSNSNSIPNSIHTSIHNSIQNSISNSNSNSISNSINNSIHNSNSNSIPNTIHNSISNSDTNSNLNTIPNSINNSIHNSNSNSIPNAIPNSINNSNSNSMPNSLHTSIRNTICNSISNSNLNTMPNSINNSICNSNSNSNLTSIPNSIHNSNSDSSSILISNSDPNSIPNSIHNSNSDSNSILISNPINISHSNSNCNSQEMHTAFNDEMTLFRFLISKLQNSKNLNEDQRAEVFLNELNDLTEQLQLRSSRLIRNTSGLHVVTTRVARVLGIPEGQYALDMTAIESPPEPETNCLNCYDHIGTTALPAASVVNNRSLDYTALSMSLDDTLTDEAAQKLNLSAGGKLLPPSEESLLRAVDDLVHVGIKTNLLNPPTNDTNTVAGDTLMPHYDHASDNAVEAVTMKPTNTTQPATPLLDLTVDFFQFNN